MQNAFEILRNANIGVLHICWMFTLFWTFGSFQDIMALACYYYERVDNVHICMLPQNKRVMEQRECIDHNGFFGVLQLAILEHIVPPDYWKENADLVRFYGAFFSQPLFCSICCGIAVILETSVNDKTARLVDELQTILEEQIGILSEIKGELIEMSAQYERTWHILKLLDNISDSYLLEKSYINERRKREKDILNKIDGTLSKKKIDIP